MLRFVLPSALSFALLFVGTADAHADVVVSNSPADSNVIVKTAPPTVVVVKHKKAEPPPPPPKRERKVGLHFDVGGTFGPDVSMGGFTGALRFRPTEHIGIDLGSGYYAGHDYLGFYRTEVPISVNALFFVNPQHKFQFYFLLGPGMTIGHADRLNEVRRMIHVGGQAGFGVELRLAPAFALNADVRGVIRHRVDQDPRPEFFDGTQGTDTSAGALVTFGGTFYF
jgi:hypothetical protein